MEPEIRVLEKSLVLLDRFLLTGEDLFEQSLPEYYTLHYCSLLAWAGCRNNPFRVNKQNMVLEIKLTPQTKSDKYTKRKGHMSNDSRILISACI